MVWYIWEGEGIEEGRIMPTETMSESPDSVAKDGAAAGRASGRSLPREGAAKAGATIVAGTETCSQSESASSEAAGSDVGGKPAGRRTSRATRHIVGYSRFIAAIPCLGLLMASVALTVSTLVSAVLLTVEVFQGVADMQDMLVEYIEFADFFLLGVVFYIMSVGLYSLFIDDEVEMPAWLEIHTLDDLKEKLIGVLGVVIGVYFLGRLIHGASASELALIGIGSAAVIVSLAYFVKHVISSHDK